MKRLLIIGASGHGKVCADIAEKMGCWEEIVFADDHPQESFPYPIIGNSNIEWDDDCFIGIGNAEVREKLSIGRKLVTLVHPQAVIGNRVEIGAGTAIMAGAVVNVDAVIGKGCIINTCASVDHDCHLGNYVHVSVGAHISGTVDISNSTWISAGATVINNISICSGCMIGAGAVVVDSIIVSGTYIGIPARRINGK